MVSVETISIVFTGLSVSLAAFYYISTLRNEQRTQQLQLETRQAQLFMQIYNRWSSPEMTKGYGFLRYQYPQLEGENVFYETTEPYDEEKCVHLHSLNQFFEGIAVLVETGLIDIALVEKPFSRRVIWFWERMETLYMFVRKHLDDPTQYDSLEHLYNELKQREQQRMTSKYQELRT